MSTEQPEPPFIEPVNPDAPVEQPEAIPPPASQGKRNQHLKADDPKSRQLTGRATESEYQRINEAIEVRKQPGTTYDIVRFALAMMDYIESDILQSFTTKKKR